MNAYKRLQPGQLNGYYANWVSITAGSPSGCHRRGDPGPVSNIASLTGATSVHVAAAACLLSSLRGVQMELDCPPAETQDCITGVDTDVSVPPTLGAALDALEADQDFVAAFSPGYVEGFLAVKRAEWQTFVTSTTDWELEEYLEYY